MANCESYYGFEKCGTSHILWNAARETAKNTGLFKLWPVPHYYENTPDRSREIAPKIVENSPIGRGIYAIGQRCGKRNEDLISLSSNGSRLSPSSGAGGNVFYGRFRIAMVGQFGISAFQTPLAGNAVFSLFHIDLGGNSSILTSIQL